MKISTFIFLSLLTTGNDCFKQISAEHAKKIIMEYGGIHSPKFQIPTNKAFVYEIGNDSLILIDVSFNGFGLLLSNENCLKKMLEDDSFPIEEVRQDPFSKYRTTFLAIFNEPTQSMLDRVKEKMELEQINFNREELIHVFGHYSKNYKSFPDFLDILKLIGEYSFRYHKQINERWIVVKEYRGYNPSYLPAILREDNEIITFAHQVYNSYFFPKKSINIEQILKNFIERNIFNSENIDDFKARFTYDPVIIPIGQLFDHFLKGKRALSWLNPAVLRDAIATAMSTFFASAGSLFLPLSKRTTHNPIDIPYKNNEINLQ